MPRILISAGEVSGDLHAAAVIRALKERMPDVEITGIAGVRMQQAGCRPLHDMDERNVLGLGDVIAALPRIRRVQQSLLAWCGEHHPDLAVLVDFSGFHMRLGRRLRRMGIPVLHYIAPKLWAWGSWRTRMLRKSQDRLACILPFEPAWFAGHGIDACYVGNPSAFSCRKGWSSAELRSRLGISSRSRLLALLPGSRPGELQRHVALLADVWREVRERMPDIHAVVPLAPGVSRQMLMPLTAAGALVVERSEDGYALRADAAVVVSGTATLELALWNVPSVLIYRGSPMMVFLARRLVATRCAGLANILLDDTPVMPELIQQQSTVENIMDALLPLLQDGEAVTGQRKAFSRLQQLLGDDDPAAGVADLAVHMLS
ncbi:MAG: lipid-A-disaccharide synthase [Mariprofundaceae bacterium]|nr:lipid-A-disaccharide synthase [Mariprofundaceae bacterium]